MPAGSTLSQLDALRAISMTWKLPSPTPMLRNGHLDGAKRSKMSA